MSGLLGEGGPDDAAGLVPTLGAARVGRHRLQVARGLSNAEVGARLFLSEATVKPYVSRVLTELERGQDGREHRYVDARPPATKWRSPGLGVAVGKVVAIEVVHSRTSIPPPKDAATVSIAMSSWQASRRPRWKRGLSRLRVL